jgi:putative SOS response-associated peptidase YedK
LAVCGRFIRTSPRAAIRDAFGLDPPPDLDLAPRYNVCPGEEVVVLATRPDGERRIGRLRWGLVPAFAESPTSGPRAINARAETILARPAFRDAFRRRRCLVVTDGFYEWRREGTTKTPYLLYLRSRRPFAFAGIWERWRSPAGETLATCAIITCPPNPLVAPIHDRMPVILPPAAYARWLDPLADDARLLLVPYPEDEMDAHPVSTLVNSPRNDSPECVRPV